MYAQKTRLLIFSCSTRVSNELGAGKPGAARVAVLAVLVLSVSEFVIASTIIFFCRYILGYAFSNEMDVVNYVKDMTPFFCVSIIMDSLQAVLSGNLSQVSLFSSRIYSVLLR